MEEWRDIPGYEGLYQASNFGKIRSLTKKIVQFNGYNYSEKKYNGKILKPSIVRGYERVLLQDKGIKRNYFVHRLVAMTFIENPNNLPYINHKDENKLNNKVENLEWCTQSYNINYGNRNKKVREKLKNKPKTIEHKMKLSENARKRKIIRDENGRIITYISLKKIKGE